MMMTILARQDGVSTSGGGTWYEKGMAWAKENGISDGSAPTAPSPASSWPSCSTARPALTPALRS